MGCLRSVLLCIFYTRCYIGVARIFAPGCTIRHVWHIKVGGVINAPPKKFFDFFRLEMVILLHFIHRPMRVTAGCEQFHLMFLALWVGGHPHPCIFFHSHLQWRH